MPTRGPYPIPLTFLGADFYDVPGDACRVVLARASGQIGAAGGGYIVHSPDPNNATLQMFTSRYIANPWGEGVRYLARVVGMGWCVRTAAVAADALAATFVECRIRFSQISEPPQYGLLGQFRDLTGQQFPSMDPSPATSFGVLAQAEVTGPKLLPFLPADPDFATLEAPCVLEGSSRHNLGGTLAATTIVELIAAIAIFPKEE